MGWGFLKGLYLYATASTHVPSFREMLYDAGQAKVKKWKTKVKEVKLENKVAKMFQEVHEDHMQKTESLTKELNDVRHQFKLQDSARESLAGATKSFRDTTQLEYMEQDKRLKKKMRQSGITAVHKMRREEDENGNPAYVPLRLQGDLLMETTTSRRRRVELKRSPRIKNAVMRWWCLLGFSGYVPTSTIKGLARLVVKKNRFDTAEVAARAALVEACKTDNYTRKHQEGVLTRKEYIQMCVEIWHVLGDKDDMDEEEARAAARKDWKEDSRGQKGIMFQQFYDALFQLIDLYTVSVEEDEYVQTMNKTLDLIMHRRHNRPIPGHLDPPASFWRTLTMDVDADEVVPFELDTDLASMRPFTADELEARHMFALSDFDNDKARADMDMDETGQPARPGPPLMSLPPPLASDPADEETLRAHSKQEIQEMKREVQTRHKPADASQPSPQLSPRLPPLGLVQDAQPGFVSANA